MGLPHQRALIARPRFLCIDCLQQLLCNHPHWALTIPTPSMLPGANLDVDVPWKWLNFFLEDDAKLEQVGGDRWAVLECVFWIFSDDVLFDSRGSAVARRVEERFWTRCG